MTIAFRVYIDCGNAAFGETEDDRGAEVARILRKLADQVEGGYIKSQLIDLNGNAVGVGSFLEEPYVV